MTMTGRYVRKTTLEIRGLSRLPGFDEHPTTILEQPEDPSLPRDYLRSVEAALSTYHSGLSDSSPSSPTTAADTQSTTSNSQPFWKSGNTTERSSVDSTYSWDEFDKRAAQDAQKLFEEIDSVLFEQKIDGPEYIHEECQEWGSQFLHLRILGSQLFPEQEIGYQIISRVPSRPSSGSIGLMDVTDQDLNTTQDFQGLTITGQQSQILTAPVDAFSPDSDGTSLYSHLEEEIFEQEGEYEEIIAVDYKDIYEDNLNQKKQLTPRRRRVGYPPITPNACVKDSVASSAFDCLWQEIMSWMRLLLERYRSLIFEESKGIAVGFPDTSLNQIRDDPAPSRDPSFILHKIPRAHTHVGNFDPPQLHGMLQISRIDLQTREKSTMHDTPESQVMINSARPMSSIPTTLKPRPMSVKYPLRNKVVGTRLAPLDRSKTPSVDEERVQMAVRALRVTKLTPSMGNEPLLAPGFNQRNGALPPISSDDLEPSHSQRFQGQRKIMASSSRASSAVEKEHRNLFGGRMSAQADINRPSTTHAMRSDTPFGTFRRASTPFTTTRHLNTMLVSGSGLQPSSDLSHLTNIPQDILEDPEGALEDVIHNQWTPGTPNHNPYRRGRQLSSLVKS